MHLLFLTAMIFQFTSISQAERHVSQGKQRPLATRPAAEATPMLDLKLIEVRRLLNIIESYGTQESTKALDRLVSQGNSLIPMLTQIFLQDTFEEDGHEAILKVLWAMKTKKAVGLFLKGLTHSDPDVVGYTLAKLLKEASTPIEAKSTPFYKKIAKSLPLVLDGLQEVNIPHAFLAIEQYGHFNRKETLSRLKKVPFGAPYEPFRTSAIAELQLYKWNE